VGQVEKPLQRADMVDASRQILGALIVDVECNDHQLPATGRPCGCYTRPRRQIGVDKFRATLSAESIANVDEWQTEVQLKPVRLGRIWLCTSS